jgi:hypothetical protein
MQGLDEVGHAQRGLDGQSRGAAQIMVLKGGQGEALALKVGCSG